MYRNLFVFFLICKTIPLGKLIRNKIPSSNTNIVKDLSLDISPHKYVA